MSESVSESAKSGEPPVGTGREGAPREGNEPTTLNGHETEIPRRDGFFCGFERMARLRRPPSRRRASIFMRHFRTPLNGQSNTK